MSTDNTSPHEWEKFLLITRNYAQLFCLIRSSLSKSGLKAETHRTRYSTTRRDFPFSLTDNFDPGLSFSNSLEALEHFQFFGIHISFKISFYLISFYINFQKLKNRVVKSPLGYSAHHKSYKFNSINYTISAKIIVGSECTFCAIDIYGKKNMYGCLSRENCISIVVVY
jgi:hypothetical protein